MRRGGCAAPARRTATLPWPRRLSPARILTHLRPWDLAPKHRTHLSSDVVLTCRTRHTKAPTVASNAGEGTHDSRLAASVAQMRFVLFELPASLSARVARERGNLTGVVGLASNPFAAAKSRPLASNRCDCTVRDPPGPKAPLRLWSPQYLSSSLRNAGVRCRRTHGPQAGLAKSSRAPGQSETRVHRPPTAAHERSHNPHGVLPTPIREDLTRSCKMARRGHDQPSGPSHPKLSWSVESSPGPSGHLWHGIESVTVIPAGPGMDLTPSQMRRRTFPARSRATPTRDTHIRSLRAHFSIMPTPGLWRPAPPPLPSASSLKAAATASERIRVGSAACALRRCSRHAAMPLRARARTQQAPDPPAAPLQRAGARSPLSPVLSQRSDLPPARGLGRCEWGCFARAAGLLGISPTRVF